MELWLSDYYEWIRALHIISMICWMAGLLYLPRLFVYHVGAEYSSELDLTFRQMERRLLRYIMHPSMVCTVVFGMLMMAKLGLAGQKWLHIKILLVLFLIIMHLLLSRCVKLFALGRNQRSKKFFKVLNEAPTLLMIFIIFLVVLKPF